MNYEPKRSKSFLEPRRRRSEVDLRSPGTAANLVKESRPAVTRFDSFLGKYLPGVALGRARARYRAAQFERAAHVLRIDAATTGRRTEGWFAPGGSMVAETDFGLNKLRARSRDLVLNNDLASTAVEVLQSALVGSGIKPKAVRKPSSARARKAQSLWKAWGETSQIDPGAQLNAYALQSLAVRSMIETGEVLLRRLPRRRSDGLDVPLQVQLLEGDHIDTSKTRSSTTLTDGTRVNKIVQGVEFDRSNRPVAYWLFEEHPGDRYYSTLESKRVPSEDIIHLFEVLRPGQVRGIPRGTPCLLRLRDWDSYADAQLIRQQLAACFVGFVHDMELDGDGPASEKEFEDDELQPGLIKGLPTGKSITFGKPPEVEGIADYARVTWQPIASCFRVTYAELTGDMTKENFSSSRMAGLNIGRSRARLRANYLIPQLGARIWAWMVSAAVTDGTLDSPDVPALWTAPRQFLTDPAREVPALIRSARAGFTSISGAIREQGLDPEAVFDELEEDYEELDRRGLVLETDGRVPVAGSADSSSEEGDDGDEKDGEDDKDDAGDKDSKR